MLELSKAAQPVPCVTTSTAKESWWVVSRRQLTGSQAPICQPDTLSREVLLPWGSCQGCLWETKKPCTAHCYLLLLFHTGASDTSRSRLRREWQWRLWSAESILPAKRKGLNLVSQQTGLVPKPGVWLLQPWDLLWEPALLRANLSEKGKSIFSHSLGKQWRGL